MGKEARSYEEMLEDVAAKDLAPVFLAHEETTRRPFVWSDSLRMGAVGTSKGSQDLHKLS